MCFYNDGCTTFARSKVTKARKPHKCEECAHVIQPGDIYRYGCGLYEGDFYQVFMCAHCEFVREMIAHVERSRGCSEDEAWPPIGNLAGDWADGGYAAELGLYDPNDDEADEPTFWDLPRW